MYASYKHDSRVAMYLVYLQEGHPEAGNRRGRGGERPAFAEHRTLADRIAAAKACARRLKLSLPILVDTMERAAGRAFQARWGATLVVDRNGKVALYREGFDGVRPSEAASVLQRLLSR